MHIQILYVLEIKLIIVYLKCIFGDIDNYFGKNIMILYYLFSILKYHYIYKNQNIVLFSQNLLHKNLNIVIFIITNSNLFL